MAIYKTLVKKISVSADMKTKQKEYLKKGKLAIVDQGQQLVGGYSDDENKKVDCNLPVIVFGDHTRCVKFISFPFGAGADGTKILAPQDGILPKYLYYGTQYLVLKMPDKGYARHYQHLEKMELPVPEIEVQKQIVDKIEELLSEIESGVGTLVKAGNQIRQYKQSLLKTSFENFDDDCTMGDLATMVDPQPSHRTPPEYENGIPYIGIGDIDYSEKSINFKDARKVSPTVLEEHLNRYTLHEGDFVMGKIGTIGKPFKLPLPQNYTLSANVILIQPDEDKILPEFLFWQFSSPLITEQLMEGKNETSQPAFGIQKARLLRIKMCNFEEQQKTVKYLREKMSVADSIEKTINTTLLQAEALKQSVLKKAFEGEL